MKKIISLLAVATFALTFAAGCGKMEKCSEADGKNKAICEKKEDFKDNKQCVWAPAASGKDADGKCKDKEDATTTHSAPSTASWNAASTSAAECDKPTAVDAASCSALDATLTAKATDKCIFDAAKTPKCFPAQK